MRKEILGYKKVQCRKVMCIITSICTCGLLWLLFYWKPEWEAWLTCKPCLLEEADVVLIRSMDEFKKCSKKNILWTQLSENDSLTLGRCAFEDSHSIINKAILMPEQKIRYFRFQKIKYVWLISQNTFQKVGKILCGPNVIETEVTPVWKLLFKEVLNPFYLFQAATLSLWIAEGYIEYSVSIIIMTLISIIFIVFDLRQQSVKLNRMVESTHSCSVTVVMRNGDHCVVESRQLVPGDLIVIPREEFFLPCDCILLKGSCIVNESMLTGESVPVTKIPLDSTSSSTPWKTHSGEDYKKHVLFCGTEVIQATSIGLEPVTAVVMQTGFITAKGDMVRSILYPKPVNFKLHRDATRFLMCIMAIAAVGFIYCVILFKVKGASVRDIIVKSLLSFTAAIPPILPAALSTALLYSQKRLKKEKIFCLSPERINVCGRVNLVCFDKTGTLTEDGLDLWGVVPCIENRFQTIHMFSKGSTLPWCPLLGAMVSCHSLIKINGKIQGDPLDLKMFEGTNWIPVEGITILQQFPFSSGLQRMSVIAKVIGTEEHLVFMKGAPEMVIQFCNTESVPANFTDQLLLYTSQGFRVIGLSYKSLQVTDFECKDSYPRSEVECDLIFLGLLILENRVKKETSPAISELNNALIRTVMVTGDNIQTAVTVARTCGIIPTQGRVILTEASEPNENTPATISWKPMEANGNIVHATGIETEIKTHDKSQGNTDYYFAMSGKTFQIIILHFYDLLPKLLLNGAIFARMSPGQKAKLVEEFQKLDYYVAMCGDGANDCGALKAAHVGISLSEQEASVASPFTSQIANIQCVPQLIKEGRAALVSSFAIFKYVTSYALIQFITLLLLYWELKSVGMYQYLIQDMAITLLVTLTLSLSHPCLKLAPYRPPAQLISPPLLVSLIFNFLLSLASQICGFLLVQKQPWYSSSNYRACVPANESIATVGFNISNVSSTELADSSIYESFESTTLWLLTTPSLIILAFVFSKGKPFRKPIYTNYLFFCLLPVQLAVSLLILFINSERVYRAMQLVCIPFLWRIVIFIMLLVFFLVSYFVEELFIERRYIWLFLKRIANYHSQSQYRMLHRNMKNNLRWPPLNIKQYAISSEQTKIAVFSNMSFVNDDDNILSK
ncbi:hypothetical protein GDO86_010050 [Hymenochirus boettgeri]|uniref:Cation-transporting ATPase n=1 Tax=Hymenochirus boettgeri TaxID=247094 RepID=A0A8T2JNU0_9PIPI|nr:hypothetical protein GDO86_010050 [Hymenochirus boettgeri]